jgi:uncharacterized protein
MSAPLGTAEPTPRPRQTTGVIRYALMAAGWVFVLIAVAGALLPGIPTTPWVLAAAYCFDRSSERFSKWLRSAPVFGKLIADWERYRGVRRTTKRLAVCTVVVVVSLSLTFGPLPVLAKYIIGAWACIGICVILFVVPTVPDEATISERTRTDSAE